MKQTGAKKARRHAEEAREAVPRPARTVIESVRPRLDGGRYPVKRVLGDAVVVEADIHADGHDRLRAELLYRKSGEAAWRRAPMACANPGLDLWRGSFTADSIGHWEFAVEAWVDELASWQAFVRRKAEAGDDVTGELPDGAELLRRAADRAPQAEAARLRAAVEEVLRGGAPRERAERALDPALSELSGRFPEPGAASMTSPLPVWADRERARFGAWYEMFPRSAGTKPGKHATFKEAEARLEDIAAMGFDVLYLPPIHPIARSYRKGKNNGLKAGPGDPGSPWAIGAREGGHKAVHPELGTLEDFRRFREEAERRGLELALDIAFQCSPEHPYLKEHPEWFKHRHDGTIRYAENPPKKYQDIYPFDFECAQWRSLWEEMKSVILFWAEQGVRIFRVDNPHTKPYAFWEWLLAQARAEHPDLVFLSEAFTRPRVMRHLAKLGFSQSYTYFTWRNTKDELSSYLQELSSPEWADAMRPNFFANTPDILPPILQTGGRAAFMSRFVLAATLSPSYGIYSGFELCEHAALPGREEYADSEKYEIKVRDWDAPGNIKELIAKVNSIRRDNPALRRLDGIVFYPTSNPSLLVYGKATPDGSNRLLVAVNLDPHSAQEGTAQVPAQELGLPPGSSYRVRDLLSDAVYVWGDQPFIRLDPRAEVAHILRVEGPAG